MTAAIVEFVPTTHHRRRDPCTHCGDAVLVVEYRIGRLFGLSVGRTTTLRAEHADPGPDGEVFDAVDNGCRRPRVR